MRLLAAGLLAVLGAMGAACGDDDDPASTATAGSATAAATQTASAATSPSVRTSPSVSPSPRIATVTATATPTGTATASATSATASPSGSSPAGGGTAAPTAAPAPPVAGAIAAISLASAGISASSPIEVGDTVFENGREYFEDPGAPPNIIWYPRFGQPGQPAGNTIMAGHVNYVGYGDGPFANLLEADTGDALAVSLTAGGELTYTVKSVTLYRLAEIDMEAVVFPPLDGNTERITLISCGGTFIPAASGYGGEYDSRIVLVAERAVG